jgi:hypothetical protein
MAKSGTAVIIVSHDLDQIKELCYQCLWLKKGKLMAFGNTVQVVDAYLEKFLVSNTQGYEGATIENYDLSWEHGLYIEDEIKVLNYGIRARGKQREAPLYNTDELEIRIEFEKLKSETSVEIAVSILSLFGVWVFVDSHGMYTKFDKLVIESGRYALSCNIPEGLLNFGIYQLGFLVSKSEHVIYQNPGLLNFKISHQDSSGVKSHLAKRAASIIRPTGNWEIKRIS